MWIRRKLCVACGATLTAMLLGATGAQAQAETSVRFVHAVPGAGDATLEIDGADGGSASPQAAFGEASEPEQAPSGEVELSLRVGDSGPPAATARETLAEGDSYTVIASGTGGDVQLKAYREGDAEEGVARVRMIHAAPEVGKADVLLGDREVVSGLDYRVASDYRQVTPGSYDVALTPSRGGRPILSVEDLPLNAGTTSTAVVVGSAGERLRVVPVADASAAAPGAPQTGLGGVAGDGTAVRWLIVLMGALSIGALGATAYRSTLGRDPGGAARGD